MSVFLRWGIFGILGFAALIYAYNASKRVAERRAATAGPVTTVTSNAVAPAAKLETAPPHCEAELIVAQRAREFRASAEPLDRLLRIPEIAWQEPPARRRRLEEVATTWFGHAPGPLPEDLRKTVIRNCLEFSPAP